MVCKVKVTEDVFDRGLMGDPVFGGVASWHAAELICAGLGTKYEPQHYTEDERRWAYFVRRRPFRFLGKD